MQRNVAFVLQRHDIKLIFDFLTLLSQFLVLKPVVYYIFIHFIFVTSTAD